MADSRDHKILRIGLIQNGKIVEERLLRRRESVTVGQSPRNTFVISSVAGFPKTYPLFEMKAGRYSLNFRSGMNGKVSVGDSVHDFKTLRAQKVARKKGEGYVLSLSEKSRGKVVIGDVVVLFQFVTPPPPPSKLQLPAALKGSLGQRMEWPFITSLLVSFALQVFSLGIILSKDYPIAPMGRHTIPDRFLPATQEEIEEKLPENDEEEDEEKEEEIDESAEPEKVLPKKEEPKKADPAPQKPLTIKEQKAAEAKRVRKVQGEVRDQSMLSAVGSLGGDGPTVVDTLTAGSRDLKESMTGTGNMAVARTKAETRRLEQTGSRTGTAKTIGKDVGRGSINRVERTARKERRVGRIKEKVAEAKGMGTLKQSIIKKVFKRQKKKVKSCYDKELTKDPTLSGSVKVCFDIGRSGRTSKIKIKRQGTNARVESCIKKLVKRRFIFKPPPTDGSVNVCANYVFRPPAN